MNEKVKVLEVDDCSGMWIMRQWPVWLTDAQIQGLQVCRWPLQSFNFNSSSIPIELKLARKSTVAHSSWNRDAETLVLNSTNQLHLKSLYFACQLLARKMFMELCTFGHTTSQVIVLGQWLERQCWKMGSQLWCPAILWATKSGSRCPQLQVIRLKDTETSSKSVTKEGLSSTCLRQGATHPDGKAWQDRPCQGGTDHVCSAAVRVSSLQSPAARDH